MLGPLVGEAVAGGMAPGMGAALSVTPPSAYAMGALAVAVEGGWSMAGTMRVWAMHHEAAAALPGLGPWSVLGRAYVPESGEGDPAFRPWTAVLPWIVDDPAGRAATLLSNMHAPSGVHHQAGVAVAELVDARAAGVTASEVRAIFAAFPALAPGDPLADALREGAAAGWAGDLAVAMGLVQAMRPGPWKPLAGFVAGAVAQAATAATLPGWCHVAALGLDEDVLSAMGLFEAVVASRPRRPARPVAVPAPADAGRGGSGGGAMARVLAGIRTGVAAFARPGHHRIGRP